MPRNVLSSLSKTLGEAACIAGVSRDGKFVRLYPVPFRDLDDDKRFHKYQWIKVSARKAKDDSRPETVRPDFSTIEIVSDVLSTANNWAARYQLRSSKCTISCSTMYSRHPGASSPARC